MPEHLWTPTEADLERALIDLGSRVTYPPLAPVTAAVRERLRAQPAPAQRPTWMPVRRLRHGAALAVLALALLTGAVLALSPGARTAVAAWLGLPGVVFVNRPTLPAHQAAAVGAPLHLGQRLMLPALGPPDEVYLEALAHGTQVALVYRPRPGLPRVGRTQMGLLLTEARGSFDQGPAFFKALAPGTRIEFVQVNGTTGYWLTGTPHLFWYTDPAGATIRENVRLAGNVLIWEHDGLILRLESALPQEKVLRIAASVQ